MINSFDGKYAFLSNFYPVFVQIGDDGFASAEHAYQAMKTLDPKERDLVKSCATAAKAKKAGRRVTMRPDWDTVKLSVMESIVRAKFTRDGKLRKLLIETGEEELIEGNWWGDQFWGVCKGVGQNHLGKLLMKIREELADVAPGDPR